MSANRQIIILSLALFALAAVMIYLNHLDQLGRIP
jgi:hypothetical protein